MRSILFDLDGTLADSSLGIKKSFAYTFKKLALPFPEEKTLRTLIGPPLEDSFRHYVNDVDTAVTIYREYYKKLGVFEAELYPKIQELLEQLVVNGVNLYPLC